jgi:hypothetical protein
MKYEYTVLMVAAKFGFFTMGGVIDGEKLSSELNRLGREGWELVSTFDTNMAQGATRDVVLILKRPA